jgi:outer membrane protein OmpA-like peptidoglycan-associated protein
MMRMLDAAEWALGTPGKLVVPCLPTRLFTLLRNPTASHTITPEMRLNMKQLSLAAALSLCSLSLLGVPLAQAQNTQTAQSGNLINISVSRTTQAVNYRDKTSTKIDFQGTALLPRAEGKADIDARDGRVAIKAEFSGLQPAVSFGPAYLTYVLWAISPEGRANNLGELLLDNGKVKIAVTTRLQTFAMIVTAEPYFAVTNPSDIVVIENIVRPDTKGAVTAVDAKYDLLQRGTYDQLNLTAYELNSRTPLSLYEARNAVRIAEAELALRYAPESFAKAQAALARAEDYYLRKQNKAVPTAARDAVQAAEDARSLAVSRREAERIAAQQQAEADATARARAAQADEEQRRRDADKQRLQAELAAANEAKARAEADAQRQAANAAAAQSAQQAAQSAQQAAAADAQAAQAQAAAAQAQAAATQAQAAAAQAEKDKQELRARLLDQFNRILETRDSDRGLVVNVGDVLFDTARYTLRPPAREALARFSGIVLNYPALKLTIEGHTDSTGTADFNQKLSEQRADSVRDFLVSQGLSVDSMTAVGLGPAMPVADNGTAAGRQKNRRVEIIVSGEVIGTTIGVQP